MASTAAVPLPVVEQALQQGGGGVSGETHQVQALKPAMMLHLQKMYNWHANKEDNLWHEPELSAFLKHVQGLPAETSAKLAAELVAAQADVGFNDFLKYMTSSAANIVAPVPALAQDMSFPLSSYFISSSHNTYLTGNQLYSSSSTDAYKNVLLQGCRCIEIDVWDGDESDDSSGSESHAGSGEKRRSKLKMMTEHIPTSLKGRMEKTSIGRRFGSYVDRKMNKPENSAVPAAAPAPLESGETSTSSKDSGADSQKRASTPVEPRVLHGHTLTKEVSFRDVCHAIRDYGFVVSDLPLIVSLEVHCKPQQQEVMVDIMHEIWEGCLLPVPKVDATRLPAPTELRNKILVKVKYVPTKSPVDEVTRGEPSGSADDEPPVAQVDAKGNVKQKKPSKIIQALSQLGIYTRGVSFKSFTQPEATMPCHMFSLSESAVSEVHEHNRQMLFDHNRHFMMRAYPSGMRISSSNLDAAYFWRKGIQIVALNWQNWDKGMMLNEAMFAGSGGYVLKPEGTYLLAPFSPSSLLFLNLRLAVLARHALES